MMIIDSVIKNEKRELEKVELEDKDALLILAVRDLIDAIKRSNLK